MADIADMADVEGYLIDYIHELERYMKRLDSDTLSRKDRKLFFELSNEYYDVFRQAEEIPQELLADISEFNDSIMDPENGDKGLAGKYRDNIVQHAEGYLDEAKRRRLTYNVFRHDAEILKLQSEKIEMMQQLVDLDMLQHGRITDQTQEILDVQEYEVSNGRVREIYLWEKTDSEPDMSENQDGNLSREIEKKEEPMKRLKFPYMTRETFLSVKEEIKRMGAEYVPARKGWYVSQSAGEDVISSIQDYVASHDEAIYLQLPSVVGPRNFRTMIDQLKQDGARYNPDKKLWFITEKADQSKFQQYLKGKDSVHEKLNTYKADSERQRTGNPELESVRRETPERV